MKRAVLINSCGVGGLALIGVGLWWVLPWVSLVVCGSILFGLSCVGATR